MAQGAAVLAKNSRAIRLTPAGSAHRGREIVMRNDDVGGVLDGEVWIERADEGVGQGAADELREHERWDGRGGDAGERVGEDPADADGGVGEAGGAGEPVRGADVGATAAGAEERRPLRASEKITRINPQVAMTSEKR